MKFLCLDLWASAVLVGALQQLWFSGGKRSNWFCNSVWRSSSINSGPATMGPFVVPLNAPKGIQTNLTSTHFGRPRMLPNLGPGRPQKGQNRGWGPQIWGFRHVQRHNGSALMAGSSPIGLLMNFPCLDLRGTAVLVGALQQLWFSGEKWSNWICNSVWSSSSINSEHSTIDPFVAPLNAPKITQTNLTSACFGRACCQNWPNDVRKRAKIMAGDPRSGRAAPQHTTTAVF